MSLAHYKKEKKMAEYFKVCGNTYFLYKDFEEMKVIKFLLNPRKNSLLFPRLGILLPCGEIPFSCKLVMTENRSVIFMGHTFPILAFDTPCPSSRTLRVEIAGSSQLFFRTSRLCKTEDLILVKV